MKKGLQFAKKFINEVVQFGADRGKSYVRRFPKTEFNNKFTLKTIKHGGLRLMLWGCF